MISRQFIHRRQRGISRASGSARGTGPRSLLRAAFFTSALAAAGVWVVPLSAQSTGTVSGRVIDGQTERPVANVLVRIDDTQIDEGRKRE